MRRKHGVRISKHSILNGTPCYVAKTRPAPAMPVRDGDPPPPPVAFTPEQLSQLAQALVPALVPALTAAIKPPTPPPTPEPKPEPKPTPTPTPEPSLDGLTPELRAELLESRKNQAKLAKQVETLTEQAKSERERAEAGAREVTINNALSEYTFQNAVAKTNFQKEVSSRIKVAEDGSLTVDGLPLQNAIANLLEGDYAFALKPSGAPGTGAQPGSGKAKAPKITDIKPGMTAETRESILAQMRAAHPEFQ